MCFVPFPSCAVIPQVVKHALHVNLERKDHKTRADCEVQSNAPFAVQTILKNDYRLDFMSAMVKLCTIILIWQLSPPKS